MFIKINAVPVVWLNLDNVDKAEQKMGQIKLTMKNGSSIQLDLSAEEFERAIPLFTPDKPAKPTR